MKRAKFDFFKLGSFILLVILLSSCGATKTTALRSPSLQPVAIQGTKAQVMNLAFDAAKRSFPDGKYENDGPAELIKLRRGSFWSGNTLITISCEQQQEGNWLVYAASQGVGFSKPLGDRSTAEVEFYLNALRYQYNQFLAARSASKKEASVIALSETQAVAPEKPAVQAVQTAEIETPKETAAAEAAAPAVTTTPAVKEMPPAEATPVTVAETPVTEKTPVAAVSPTEQKIKVIANRDSKRYHLPGMKYYNAVKAYHRVEFDSEADAIKAGYHKARGGVSLSEAQKATTAASAVAVSPAEQKIKVIANRDSKRYHLPGMKYYNAVEAYHRVEFDSEADAIKAGYHKARR